MVYLLANSKEEIRDAVSGAHCLINNGLTGSIEVVGTGTFDYVIGETGTFKVLNSNTGNFTVLNADQLNLGLFISGDTGKQSLTIGPAEAKRYGELIRSIDIYNKTNEFIYKGSTTDDSQTEIFLGGVQDERLSLSNNSTLGLRGFAIARCPVSGVENNSKYYMIDLCIKRDHNTTTLIHKSISGIGGNTGWFIDFDTGYRALVMKVQGSGVQSVNWLAKFDGAELIDEN